METGENEEKNEAKAENEEALTNIFEIGNCTINDELRMEDGTQNLPSGEDATLALLTTNKRRPEQPCAICYYDSNDDREDDALEAQFTRRTTTPVGRYGALAVCDTTTTNITKVCSHVFHTACLHKWISTAGGFTCPICRGGLQKQRFEGIPELFAVSPEYVVKLWPNGKIREEYFEMTGRKDGLYKSYYATGELELECMYVSGLKQGCEKHHYDDVSHAIKSEVDFYQDKKHGVSRWFTSHGKLIGEAHYEQGLKNGSHKEWYTDAATPRLRSLEHHLLGKRHGLFMKWSFQGQLLLYGVYVNDEKDGRFAAWYEEHYGLKIKEFYLNGVRHGKCAEFYEPQKNQKTLPKEIGYYDHGLRIGIWKTFWSNGQLKAQTEYNALGERDGLHFEWNRFGRPFKVFRFDGDVLDGICETFDENLNSGVAYHGPLETATYRQGELHGLYVQRYKNTGKPKLVKVFQHQQELVTRWFSRTGEVLYSTDHRALAKSKLKVHPDIVRIKRGDNVGPKLHTRFVE